MMRILQKISLITVTVLSYTSTSFAENTDSNWQMVSPQIKSICRSFQNAGVPAADKPNAELTQSLKKCDAAALYYKADFVGARQCAYFTSDYSVLTMIYANGKGVKRNWDLAIHFACQAGFAPAEIESRVQHLLQLRNNHSNTASFDRCDDVTSGYMMGICATQQEQLAQQRRQRQLATLTSGWSETEKQAFSQLQHAANGFFITRSTNEVDQSGTARVELQLEEQDSLQDDLLTAFKKLAQGEFPVYSNTQAVKLDQQLNQLYQRIIHNKNFAVGTVERVNVEKTQKIWLKYRDAWVAFGKLKYPQVSAQSWKTWLTEKRIAMLSDLDDANAANQ
jgi:uncharacterized protein YecT (DUF1311 family)